MKPYRIIQNADLIEDLLSNATWGDVFFHAGCGRVAICRDALFQDLDLQPPTRSMTWFDLCRYLIEALGYDLPEIEAREPWARAQEYGRILQNLSEFNATPNLEYSIVRDIWDGFYKQDKNVIILEDGAMWNVSGQFECWDEDVYHARMLVNQLDPMGNERWGLLSVDAPTDDPTLGNMRFKPLDECVARGLYVNDVSDLVGQAVATVDDTKKKLVDERDGFFASKTVVPGEA